MRFARRWGGSAREFAVASRRGAMYLVFRFAVEVDPRSTLKLTVEINTREQLEKPARNLTEDIVPLLLAGVCFDEAVALRAYDRLVAIVADGRGTERSH